MKLGVFGELSSVIQSDILLAETTALKRAFPGDKNTKIGCVLASGEQRWLGANIKREAWNSTTCAERMAVDKAIFDGTQQIDRIVTFGNVNEPFAPCGPCRDVVAELLSGINQHDVELVIACNNRARVVSAMLSELLPLCVFLDSPR